MGKGWKNPIKAEKAAAKGLIFTKLAREIQVAAKAGGADPNMNARLRMAIDAAKAKGCPNDTIERAIRKGAGLDNDSVVEEVAYEGFGPHGVGVIVECQTDNLHRTAPEVRNIFKRHGGAMGASGSVAWMFKRVGLIEATKTGSFDPEEEAIEAGADEVEKGTAENPEGFSFFSSMEHLADVAKALTARGWKVTTAEPSYKATNLTQVSDEQRKEVEEFLNEMDEFDDSHRVHATLA